MTILVDFDNIDKLTRSRGLHFVISKIISKIAPSEIVSGKHISVRLYGGWYMNNSFTRVAQKLSTEIGANFPTTMNLSDNSTNVMVNCEMAYSLLADPTNHLFSTFRPRGMPTGLYAYNPANCGCSQTACPITHVYDFLHQAWYSSPYRKLPSVSFSWL